MLIQLLVNGTIGRVGLVTPSLLASAASDRSVCRTRRVKLDGVGELKRDASA